MVDFLADLAFFGEVPFACSLVLFLEALAFLAEDLFAEGFSAGVAAFFLALRSSAHFLARAASSALLSFLADAEASASAAFLALVFLALLAALPGLLLDPRGLRAGVFLADGPLAFLASAFFLADAAMVTLAFEALFEADLGTATDPVDLRRAVA